MPSIKRRKVGEEVPAAVKRSQKSVSPSFSSSSPEPETANQAETDATAASVEVAKTFRDLVQSQLS